MNGRGCLVAGEKRRGGCEAGEPDGGEKKEKAWPFEEVLEDLVHAEGLLLGSG